MTARSAAFLACLLWLPAGTGCDRGTLRAPDAGADEGSDGERADGSPAQEDAGDERADRSSAAIDAGDERADASPSAASASAPGTDGQFAGGTRLQAVLAEADDGTATFLHWWDSELEVTCKFEPMEDPEQSWRCLPAATRALYEGIDELFADARCSQPLWRDGALPSGTRHVVR